MAKEADWAERKVVGWVGVGPDEDADEGVEFTKDSVRKTKPRLLWEVIQYGTGNGYCTFASAFSFPSLPLPFPSPIFNIGEKKKKKLGGGGRNARILTSDPDSEKCTEYFHSPPTPSAPPASPP